MYLLRHGQSEFNLHFTRTRRDPGIADPMLTPDGRAQARAAGRALAAMGMLRIIVSPYTRALQTAAEVVTGLGPDAHQRVEIDVLVRERFAFTCDVGSRRAELARDWPAHDFGAIDEVWWPKRRETEAEVIARAAQFRQAMRAADDTDRTLLVSHWGFLLALTGQSLANGEWVEWDPQSPPPARVDWF